MLFYTECFSISALYMIFKENMQQFDIMKLYKIFL